MYNPIEITGINIILQISATKWGGLGLQYRLPARIFFVQTGGVGPPFLYLHSFVVDVC